MKSLKSNSIIFIVITFPPGITAYTYTVRARYTKDGFSGSHPEIVAVIIILWVPNIFANAPGPYYHMGLGRVRLGTPTVDVDPPTLGVATSARDWQLVS